MENYEDFKNLQNSLAKSIENILWERRGSDPIECEGKLADQIQAEVSLNNQ